MTTPPQDDSVNPSESDRANAESDAAGSVDHPLTEPSPASTSPENEDETTTDVPGAPHAVAAPTSRHPQDLPVAAYPGHRPPGALGPPLASVANHRPLRVAPLHSISYLQSYWYIFDNDQWMVSVLVGGLCVFVAQFLPLVPYIVFGGYLLMVIESLVETPDQPYPEFNFDRFTDYMGKAVWSFLVALPFLLVVFLVYLGSYFGSVFGVILLASSQDPETVGLSLSIGLPLYFFSILVFVAASWILSMSMMLRAGLTGSFTEAFRMRWIVDFIRRNWVEHVLVFTFVSLTSMVMSILGLALFCVGTFATSAMSLMALAHLMAQLYRLHVTRGGEIIRRAEVDRSPRAALESPA